MIRSLVFVIALLVGGPVTAEERDVLLAQADQVGTEASESGTTEDAASDPAALWEADRSAILPAEGVDLGEFEYLARPLVIFGDSPRQPQVVEQLRLLEQQIADLASRDVVVILDTDPEARSPARQELRPRGFALVLLEKDGRVTLRRPAPLSVREITRAIDRSPLRQEELRNGVGSEPTN